MFVVTMRSAPAKILAASFSLLVLLVPAYAADAIGANSAVVVVVDDAFVNRSITAAELSILAESGNPSPAGYGTFQAFADGSSRAIVAKKDGVCFAAFGSSGSGFGAIGRLGGFIGGGNDFSPVCQSTADPARCCDGRSGAVGSYVRSSFRSALRAAVAACAAPCTAAANNGTCVVFTGHSQGGAGTSHVPCLDRWPPTLLLYVRLSLIIAGLNFIFSLDFSQWRTSQESTWRT